MDILIARQPIFDIHGQVYAYELLYRKNNINSYSSDDGDFASSVVMSGGFLALNFDTLTGGKKAFVNFTQKLLKEKVATIFPSESLAVEILETVKPVKEIIDACKALKTAGYCIALDDFVFYPGYEPFIELADIVKVDFLQTSDQDKKYLVSRFKRKNLSFLAEKIETQEEYKKALDFGYTFFQGYFFARPEILSSHTLSPYKLNYLDMIKTIHTDDPDIAQLTKIIERDMAFSYEIIKIVNSAYYYRGSKIKSIRQAIVLLGLRELKKWIYLAIIRKIGEDRPDEIINYSMIRSKFMELLAQLIDEAHRSHEFMMLGMFSMIDALMNAPMKEVLRKIPLSDDIKDILMEKASDDTQYFCFQLLLAYERADLGNIVHYAEKLKLKIEDINDVYYKSLTWMESIRKYRET